MPFVCYSLYHYCLVCLFIFTFVLERAMQRAFVIVIIVVFYSHPLAAVTESSICYYLDAIARTTHALRRMFRDVDEK